MKNNNLIQQINWEKVDGLVPAIIQNLQTGQVLMFGYMDEEALTKTLQDNRVWFYSRTKKRLWMKGEKSGNILNVIKINLDCDSDTLLVTVNPEGPTCHKGTKSCFGDVESSIFNDLYEVIEDRKLNMPEDSYTTSLFTDGIDEICGKVEEEAQEVVQAAKFETKERLIEESVDVLYHLFVLLIEKGVSLKEIMCEIKKRRLK